MARRPPLWYRLGMRAAAGAAPLAARFNPKLAKGLEGRRQLLDRLTAWGSAYRDVSRPLIWMHAPSVGEGLQAKPVIEMLRSTHPEWQIAYTFFSPSAERLARSLPADVADYLPWDRPDAVRGALEALKPTALVYSKLDVWPELTLGAAARGVKLGLISATVSPTSSRLNWPARGWSRTAYEALDKIGAISEADASRLELLGARPSAMSVTGDTRYDSVLERAGRLDPTIDALTRLEVPAGGAFTIVAG
ncbi:MAG TPA: glycosyltransferase N-terminal domain-containing protein, partial [Gemmatimonadales bacterium]|nr:glycosyltransferase N-terminal domain-containing protein [Gemmatimonadales bacterium]